MSVGVEDSAALSPEEAGAAPEEASDGAEAAADADLFVRATPAGLMLGEEPFRFIGINMWQAAWVAAASPARLRHELDVLREHGVSVLRITALSEGAADAPLQVVPSLQPSAGVFDEHLAESLDLVLYELRRRQMRAILVLNNEWTWSGGFATYLVWARGGSWRDIPFPSSHLSGYWEARPAHARPKVVDGDWDRYQKWVTAFYSTPAAVELADASMHWLLQRRNALSAVRYSEDATILAFQLCNEPRAVSAESGALAARLAMLRWVRHSAGLLKQLAPRTMVMVGSEGSTPFESYVNVDFEAIHTVDDVDVVTAHVWPENWGWGDASSGARLASALEHALAYMADQARRAAALGKPLVLEEFGFARDRQLFSADGSTTLRRNAFYSAILRAASAAGVAGVMPWGWGGAGRPRSPGSYWQVGDDFLGDPPHEAQGWYSVFDTDASTLRVLRQGFSASHVPPMPPAPPAPPPPPPQPHYAPPPACTSEHADDAPSERCESWCVDRDHCSYCKCRGCELCRKHG